MRNYILYTLCLLGILSISSCDEKSSWDQSVITYFATLELEGDAAMIWAKDQPYIEPGYSAEMRGEDVTGQVVVSGSVDVAKPGVYTLTYSITNADGFVNSASRLVMVFDPIDSPIESGFWNTDPTSYRDYNGKTSFGKSFIISIFQTAPGIFYVSDFFGGWYDQRAGYGSNYAMTGTFRLNEDNTLTLLSSHINGWGDSLDEMIEGTLDIESGTIFWSVGYAGENAIKFYVTLTK